MGYHVDIIWISLDWLSWENLQIWDIQFLLNLGKASNRVTYNQTWQPFAGFTSFPCQKVLTDQGNYQRNQMEHRWSLALNLWLHWLHWLLHLDGLSGHGMDVRLPLLRLAILHRGSVVVGMHGAEKSKVKVIFTSPYGSRRITLPNEWGWTCINLSYVQGWV